MIVVHYPFFSTEKLEFLWAGIRHHRIIGLMPHATRQMEESHKITRCSGCLDTNYICAYLILLYHQSIHYFWLAFFDLSSDPAGFHISLTFIDLSPLSSSRLIWQAVGPTRPFGNGAALTQTTTQPCQDTNSFQCGHHCRYQ